MTPRYIDHDEALRLHQEWVLRNWRILHGLEGPPPEANFVITVAGETTLAE